MTTEEKAKAYDEIIVKAKEYLKDCPDRVDAKGCITHLISELSESKDERIRKAIYELVKQSSEILEKKNQESMIAWLEKQGEQKSIKEQQKEIDYAYRRGLKDCFDEIRRVNQIESSDTDFIRDEIFDIISALPLSDKRTGMLLWLESQKFKTLKEQKLAEEIRGNNCGISPNIEWSEEDEQYLLVCKNALAKYQVSDKWDANIISRWLENKLKSIRSQKRWKPTKEQLYILNWVQLGLGDGLVAEKARSVMESLYNDLKAL